MWAVRRLMDGLNTIIGYAILFGFAGGFLVWLVAERYWPRATLVMAAIPFVLFFLMSGSPEIAIILGIFSAISSAFGLVFALIVKRIVGALRR